MAHYVKCVICNERFDADKYKAILVKPRRYAHASCVGKLSPEETEEEKDYKALEQYVKQLFELERMDGKITLQIKKLMQDHPEYTYSGIRSSLYYFYEVKKNPLKKEQYGNSINIVPWVYEDAKRYFYEQWQLSQKNSDKNIQEYLPKIKEILIKDPIRDPYRRKVFMFLDEEEVKNCGE